MTDARTIPADSLSAQRLAEQGLTYRLINNASAADIDGFQRADARGFADDDPTSAELGEIRPHLAERRNVGVFDDAADADAWPIATLNSWVTPLTVPGGELPMWAISSVTVAGTHRRRGIARNLLEGELRAAASAGVAVAGLTASEATIYRRYGFAPAIPVAQFTIDTRRAGWAAESPTGRVEYIDRPALAAELDAVHGAVRGQRAGQIDGWPLRWQRMAGLLTGQSKAAATRGVRWIDDDGRTQGVMAYHLAEAEGTFRFEMRVGHLAAATPEALRALWHFALHHDLVDKVSVDLRPVDDPLPWLVSDPRAVTLTMHDHGWLRILDLPPALGARTYSAPLDMVLRVTDSLGFAEGTWRISIGTNGKASVAQSADAADVTLSIVELSALYVGGAHARTLAAAGRIEGDAERVAELDEAFRTAEAPLLGIWY